MAADPPPKTPQRRAKKSEPAKTAPAGDVKKAAAQKPVAKSKPKTPAAKTTVAKTATVKKAAPRRATAPRRTAVLPATLLTDFDLYLFNEGTHFELYKKMGAHPGMVEGQAGVFFALWAPNASHVAVMGDFNDWCEDTHRLFPQK